MIQPGEVSESTWLVAGGRPAGEGRPLNHPIVPASNFSPGGAHWYARSDGTETVDALEALTGGLERGTVVAFASGMAAAAAVLERVPVGGDVVLPVDCYHGVVGLVADGVEAGRWALHRVAAGGDWLGALDADLVWLESPSNPLLEEVDVASICAAPRRGMVAVDATFLTPLRVRPLDLGADVVIHSATKFIGGHSDLVLGLAGARDERLIEHLRRVRSLHGAAPGALEAFLALRGIRTLEVRLDRMEHNAALLAGRLAGHRAVTRVRYPGRGAVLSFELAGGDEAADRACDLVRLVVHATSLGGVETTMERRSGYASSGHLPPGLVRMSVGIEDVDDLWRDLDTALGG